MFFISGFCGLLYQIIWLRIAFTSFGIIAPILSVVISVFMLGLSLGSWAGGKWIFYFKKKVNLSAIIFYGLAETIIGLGAFVVPHLFTFGETLLLPLGEVNSTKYLFFSALILGTSIFPFCFAMGTTYPFIMSFVQESKLSERTSFSFLYLANGIGATLGTIITAAFLVEKLGFSNTLSFGAFGNFSLAIICLMKGVYSKTTQKKQQANIPLNKISIESWLINKKHRVYSVLFVTGLTSLAMEVAWIRGFTPVLKTTIYSFAAILATYLFSTILGSQLYRRHLNRHKTIPTIKIIGACYIFSLFPIFLGNPDTHPTTPILLASILPLCMALGYLTPNLIDQVSQGDPNEAGRAYAINIFGGILGPLLAGYFFIPKFGVKSTLVLLSIPYGILFFNYIYSTEVSRVFKWTIGIMGTLGAIISIFFITGPEIPSSSSKDSIILRDSTATVVASGKGMMKRLFVNGVSITYLTPITKMMVHLPLSIRDKKPESALIIALGMGTSLRSAASWGINVKCVELVPSVLEAFPYFYKDASLILKKPNVKVIIDDGRRYLNRTKDKYDVIIIDPPPPIEAAGSSLLYSLEFYKVITEHLNENGIFHQWFPQGEAKIFRAIVRSLVDVFPYIRVYRSVEGWGHHFLASMQPFKTPTPKDAVSRLPATAKDDIVEWDRGIQFSSNIARVARVEQYFSRSFEKEIPVELLLNQKDELAFISDDQPYNEYYLLRRHHDAKSGSLEYVK